MAKSYNKSRATKVEKSSEISASSVKVSKQTIKKLKKYPAVIAVVVFLVIGTIVGYVLAPKFNSFELGTYTVNGIEQENDYVEIDLTEVKDDLSNSPSEVVTIDDIINAVTLNDGGAKATFLGKSVDSTIIKTYYYREDGTKPYEKVDSLDLSKAGIYYEEFTSSHFAFRSSKLIRTIIVTGVEQDG